MSEKCLNYLLAAGASLLLAAGMNATAQLPQIKIENPQSGFPTGRLGYAVAIDGDTMIAGAPFTNVVEKIEAGEARVFTRDAAGEWQLEAELIAADAKPGDQFGRSVALAGDTAFVGAPLRREAEFGIGAAFLFTREDGAWTQQAKLIAADPGVYDHFGNSIAISGDTVVIGAHLDDDGGVDSGSAYIFTRTNGVWSQQAKLTAPDAAAGDHFGYAVAIAGETVAIGCDQDDDAGNASGSAYIFTRENVSWSQQAKLTAGADAGAKQRFGINVALSAVTAAIGTGGYGYVHGGGYVYVFTRTGESWARQARIGTNLSNSVLYGSYHTLYSDTLVIGGSSVSVYTRSGEAWSRQAELGPASIGYAVAISGDTIVAGAPTHPAGSSDSGAVYIFTHSAGIWSEQQRLSGPGPLQSAEGDLFGFSVALSGNTAIVGAPADDDRLETRTAYIFTRQNGVWTKEAELTGDVDVPYVRLGYSVAIDGDTAVTGTDGNSPGSTLVFTREDGVWSQQTKLRSGNIVAISGDTIAIGDSDSDAVFIYTRADGIWSQQAILTASDGESYDLFGNSVALDGDTILVGAYFEDDGIDFSGSAYVFTRSNGVWSEQVKIPNPEPEWLDFFGSAVALSGDTALIGADGDNNIGGGIGSAYVYTRSGAVWTQQAKLTADDPLQPRFFGVSVAYSGDTAIVGASGEDHNPGAAYVFTRANGVWTKRAKLTAFDAASFDRFGRSVALSGNRLLVGAPFDDAPEVDTGSVYAFNLNFFDFIDYLLGITNDPSNLDYNGDGRIDVGDGVYDTNSF